MSAPRPDLIVVLGPTASGKTALGVGLARALGGEILSADSRQVFRGMDLGTGKDLAEYGAVPHHLIDICDPGTPFSVFDFQQRAYTVLELVRQRGRMPLLVGGTGMYLDAVLRGYRLLPVPDNPALRAELAPLSDAALQQRLQALRPQLHNSTDLRDRDRLLRAIEIAAGERDAPPPPPAPPIHPLILGIAFDADSLRQRIAQRLEARLQQGLIAEVERLRAAGVSDAWLDSCGLEYRWILRHLHGECSLDALRQGLARDIGQFAKRQRTWFRRMEKQGSVIHWLDGRQPLLQTALQQLPPLLP